MDILISVLGTAWYLIVLALGAISFLFVASIFGGVVLGSVLGIVSALRGD